MRAQSEDPVETGMRGDAHTSANKDLEAQIKSNAEKNEVNNKMKIRPQMGEAGTATTGDATLEAETMALELYEMQEARSPTGGRGDLASTMLWSPRKHAGCKRPLEVKDAEISEEEEELGNKGAETEIGIVRLVSAATAGQAPDQEIEELRGNEEEEIGRGTAAANLQMAHMERTGPSKGLDTGAPTQARVWPDEQPRKTGSGDKGEQDLQSAQQEEEEEPIGSNQGRTRPRKSNGKGRKENGERREGAIKGEDIEGP